MFSSFFSSLFVSPMVLLVLVAYLIISRKKQSSSLEEDILDTSFKSEEEPVRYNDYSNLDQTVSEKEFLYGIRLFFEDKRIAQNKRIIFKNNRYYFPLSYLKEAANLKIEDNGDKAEVYFGDSKIEIDHKKNCFKINKEKAFRVPALSFSNEYFVSLIDIAELLQLKTVFNYESMEIHVYKNKDLLANEPRKRLKRPGLIRLEDVTAGSDYSSSPDLQKLRIVGDLLASRNLPFHTAWIPRYVKPSEAIDNDLTKTFNMFNADFIYTLDYLINRGAIVGLHGYTHQHDQGESVEDSEFGKDGNPSVEWAKERSEAAIATAKQLNIPYKFFESPHYSSTAEQQQKVFEKLFDYIFEPAQGVWNSMPYLSKVNKRTIYVPAPLGYVEEDSVNEMLDRIRNNTEKDLGALFYHPYKEFDFIELNSSGYPNYKYSDSSMLKKILECLEQEGYSPVKITDIKMKR